MSNYTLEALKKLADSALANLPDSAKDEKKTIDEKRVVALQQLFLTIRRDAKANQEVDNSEFDKMTPVQREEAKIERYINLECNLRGEGVARLIVDYLERAVPNS